ncbi:hypothetical protein [Sphingobacterium humi]|uniref:Uncharacterized protein n=1 Tax=Sphingobacterium humi TaxID=1796905 RepID=A0A6N8KW36_9SPHI|nr:hypothetical protein [Sphingobacterium humi]MVZ60481.1 hypothetical protein [Sphingobacterium humi]
MQLYHLYIRTDANRRFLQPGITQNLMSLQQELQEGQACALFPQAVLNRIVYIESFNSELEANRRLQELSGLGRMVRERLIRKSNPNWLSLCPSLPMLKPTKKAVVYA